jgi:hypothetical protein
MIGCLVNNNEATVSGGGVLVNSGSLLLVDTTFNGNDAMIGKDAWVEANAVLTIAEASEGYASDGAK